MPTFRSQTFNAPQPANGDGRALIIPQTADVPASLAANDTVEFLLPAGMELTELSFQMDDLDTTTAQAWQAGYAPAQAETQYTAALTYFAAASAITTSRTGGRFLCAFKPIKFDEDMRIVLTCNAAGTPQAGQIIAIMAGNSRGVR